MQLPDNKILRNPPLVAVDLCEVRQWYRGEGGDYAVSHLQNMVVNSLRAGANIVYLQIGDEVSVVCREVSHGDVNFVDAPVFEQHPGDMRRLCWRHLQDLVRRVTRETVIPREISPPAVSQPECAPEGSMIHFIESSLRPFEFEVFALGEGKNVDTSVSVPQGITLLPSVDPFEFCRALYDHFLTIPYTPSLSRFPHFYTGNGIYSFDIDRTVCGSYLAEWLRRFCPEADLSKEYAFELQVDIDDRVVESLFLRFVAL